MLIEFTLATDILSELTLDLPLEAFDLKPFEVN